MATKKKKYRKAPKQSASLATWKKYGDHVKEVDKFNKGLDSEKKTKTSLIKKISGIKK